MVSQLGPTDFYLNFCRKKEEKESFKFSTQITSCKICLYFSKILYLIRKSDWTMKLGDYTTGIFTDSALWAGSV